MLSGALAELNFIPFEKGNSFLMESFYYLAAALRGCRLFGVSTNSHLFPGGKR
jgi:hypothetical protein